MFAAALQACVKRKSDCSFYSCLCSKALCAMVWVEARYHQLVPTVQAACLHQCKIVYIHFMFSICKQIKRNRRIINVG